MLAVDKVPNLFSYVVAYDSGFAPNPFHGFCTLATCKPDIRHAAVVGDWVIGTGSANKKTKRGGYLVHAMRVTETISTSDYWQDARFQKKKPTFGGSWLQASGDNIYEPICEGQWKQLHSYHSNSDGSQRMDHTIKDTRVPRILISEDFIYFGAHGPKIPDEVAMFKEISLVKKGIGRLKIENQNLINNFESWLNSLGVKGFCGEPWDWGSRLVKDNRDCKT